MRSCSVGVCGAAGKTAFPAQSSAKMHPALQISAANPMASIFVSPRRSSGARYHNVWISSGCFVWAASKHIARPKSQIWIKTSLSSCFSCRACSQRLLPPESPHDDPAGAAKVRRQENLKPAGTFARILSVLRSAWKILAACKCSSPANNCRQTTAISTFSNPFPRTSIFRKQLRQGNTATMESSRRQMSSKGMQ